MVYLAKHRDSFTSYLYPSRRSLYVSMINLREVFLVAGKWTGKSMKHM
jgi:hypothetical protein